MNILIYNSMPFHHEVIGFLLHYLNEKGIVPFLCNKLDMEGYNSLYQKLGYKFMLVDNFDKQDYTYLISITDSDLRLTDIIPEKTICINHWYKKRNYLIPNQINLAPFQSESYNNDYTLTVHPIVNYDEKVRLYTENKIRVVVMGRAVPYKAEYFNFITNSNVVYEVISKQEIPLKVTEKVKVHVGISIEDLTNIIGNSHYILVTDINRDHLLGYSCSASISYAFTFGCQLIIPEKMNSHLRLRSAILYDHNRELHLAQPNLPLVYKERDEIIANRNRVLDRYITIRLINKTIHQFCLLPYDANKIPTFVKQNIVRLNPTYDYQLYTSESIEKILKTYPLVAAKYSMLLGKVLPCHLKDLLMMLILYEYGGIYFDLDQEPLVPFDEILFDNSFVSCIPLDTNDGLCTGFIACNRRSPILCMMLDDFLQYDYNMIAYLGYATLCKRAGEILKRYMGVDNLSEGIHYVKSEKILLAKEVGNDNKSCQMVYNGKIICNSRYSDYPWNL